MRATFVSEPLAPLESSFDEAMMARGEPGLPRVFRWRKREWMVAEILESWKEHGDCAHGSGERYVRKHVYRIRTIDGWVLRLYFQRSFGRGKFTIKSRWWVHSIEVRPAIAKAPVNLAKTKLSSPKRLGHDFVPSE